MVELNIVWVMNIKVDVSKLWIVVMLNVVAVMLLILDVMLVSIVEAEPC